MARKKYFISGDIHSAYTPWMEALEEAGFDENNKDHIIIVLGDLTDRMDETVECIEFVEKMLKKKKLIYILGNHESPLMLEMLQRGYYESHDMSNKTVNTVLDLAGITDYESNWWGIRGITEDEWKEACKIAEKRLKPLYKQAVNYYETANYIMTHGFIPLNYEVVDDEANRKLPIEYRKRIRAYNPDWRKAQDWEWDDARWTNGPLALENGLNQTGKTLVVGHIHTSWIRTLKAQKEAFDTGDEYFDVEDYQWGERSDFSPYYFEDGRGICCDSCVAHTGRVNVVVVEDEELEDGQG